jgi:indolepyruvate ferredoxin oxidoreductase beta subunit
MNERITNILVAGIGGQGVTTATEILAQAAIANGFDVKKTEVAGMAQRGGVVNSHLRFGRKVLSPVIPAGCADILVAFEVAEGLRWSGELRPTGIALINTLRLPPPVVSSGLFAYPDDPVGMLRAAGVTVHAFDASAIALALGEIRLINTVMLGAIADHLPFPAEDLKEQILSRFRTRKPEVATLNERAFEAGRAGARAAAESLTPSPAVSVVP